jgi:hypothetical protein
VQGERKAGKTGADYEYVERCLHIFHGR